MIVCAGRAKQVHSARLCRRASRVQTLGVRRRSQPRTPTTTPNDPLLPRRDATTNVRTALRAEPSFAPFIPSQKSRTCNAVSNMQRLVSPQNIPPNKSFCLLSPFNREPRYGPFSVALAPSQGRSYLAYYQASISPLFHGACVLFSTARSHLTSYSR